MKLRTGDFAVIGCVLLLAVIIWLRPLTAKTGACAQVSYNGGENIYLPLTEDRELELAGCRILVRDGELCVAESDCPDRVCINTGKISKNGEAIICIPNRISIKISGESGFDALVG